MNWQDYVVAVLLLLCVGYIGKRVWVFFRKAGKKEKNVCEGCMGCGNDFKHTTPQKERDWSNVTKKRRKSCCG